MKMHDTVDTETLERYVRNELAEPERRAFEEHLFECSECFEQVQEMERFVAGVRHAGAAGLLTAQSRWVPRFSPVFAGAFALVVAIAGVSIWALTRSLDQARRQGVMLAQQLREVNAASALAQQRAELRAASLPLVILQASRSQTEQELAVNSAREIALWIEVAPGNRSYSVEVSNSQDHLIQHAEQLKANRYGALAVVLPAQKLPPERYIVRLFGEDPRRLLGQYLVKVTAE